MHHKCGNRATFSRSACTISAVYMHRFRRRIQKTQKLWEIIFLKFRDQEEEAYKMRNMKKFIDIELEPDA